MSAAEPIAPAAGAPWPAWLRRRTGVEFLGPPRLFFAWLTIALSLVVLVYVGAWNAAKYPVPLGYDAQPNIDYMHILLDQHHIPRPDQSAESNQPPAYYFVAEVAARAGHETFGWLEARPYTQLPEASYRGAQILNVFLVFLTALCVLWLARVVAPDRPWVWAAGVGFFAFLPVVSKTEAMIHAENLNMLTSTAALATAVHMLVRRTFLRWLVGLLAFTLALGLATRASMIFTVAAVTVGFGAALTVREIREHIAWRRVAAVFGAVLVLAMPWVVYRGVVQHQGPLNETNRLVNAALHPGNHSLSDYLTTHSRFFHIAQRGVFTSPWRSNYKNEALPETYTEIWGDWLAAFAWSAYSGQPSSAAQRILQDQSYIGVVPTAFAIIGWLGLCWVALRRRRDLVVLAVMPIFGVGGYLYRSWVTLTHDGDLFKAAYALNTVSVWALGFALATAWLASKSRLAGFGMIVLFAIFAVLELRFTMYGIRDNHPIF